jgi:hypothetical protein
MKYHISSTSRLSLSVDGQKNHIIILTDLLDYESETLSQFINLGVLFISKAAQPIQTHKVKPKALCHFNN